MAGRAAQKKEPVDDAVGRTRSRTDANRGSRVLATRRRRMIDNVSIDNVLASAELAPDVVLFRNGHASLRIERAANGTFELVLNAHGEEVTAYDLTADAVAAIGNKLMTVACA